MTALRWSRRALVFFVASFLLGLAVPTLTNREALVTPAFWVCVLSIAGAVGASIIALTAQLALARRRRKGRAKVHG